MRGVAGQEGGTGPRIQDVQVQVHKYLLHLHPPPKHLTLNILAETSFINFKETPNKFDSYWIQR